MENQNYKNHGKMVKGFHYVGGLLMLLIFIGSIVNLVISSNENVYSASLILALSVLFFIISYYVRAFALKAQDRAIRAEENFRHFLLAGKPLNKDLKMSQIIGLRFAPDDEFLELANRAVLENLSSDEIKKAIKNWKPDTNRV